VEVKERGRKERGRGGGLVAWLRKCRVQEGDLMPSCDSCVSTGRSSHAQQNRVRAKQSSVWGYKRGLLPLLLPLSDESGGGSRASNRPRSSSSSESARKGIQK
jgi:hypothetical protein